MILTGLGGGTPGGSTTQLQFNNAGTFGGITGATTNGTTLTLVAPVLGAATATSISVGLNTPGFTQQRPNANTSQILIQSTVPPEGRLHEAPFMWLQGGAAFDAGEWDPVMYLGYNADLAVATEPSVRWVIEGNYANNGRRDVEAYLEYLPTSGIGYRPIFWFADKAVPPMAGGLTFQAGNVVFDPVTAATDMVMLLYGTGVFGGSIGNGQPGANQRISILGSGNNTTGSQISLHANVWTLAAGMRGAIYMAPGNPSSPVSGSADGAIVLYSADGTERFRLQPNGNIALNKTGVNATAKLHIGAGSATAATAPLKFTSGALNTTAEAGAVEFLTDRFYGTITTGAARKTFAFLDDITGGVPGGSTTQVQYNNAGAFAGISGATTNGTALTLVAPVLGTPASVTLTNATGLPLGGLTGLGANVGTFLGTPSSANLLAAVTGPTGTGALVFGTGPTLTAPVIITGVVGSSALTINGATQTANVPLLAISQTWNNAAVTFVGKSISVTSTASAAGSDLGQWLIGGAVVMAIHKGGGIRFGPYSSGNSQLLKSGVLGNGIVAILFDGSNYAPFGASELHTQNGIYLGTGIGSATSIIFSEASGTISQSYATTAQAYRWYRTRTDASNYVRGALQTGSDYIEVAAETAGSGADDLDVRLTPVGTGRVNFPGGTLLKTRAALTDGAAAALGTLANAPVAGNPTKWIPINDNGTTRYIPAW